MVQRVKPIFHPRQKSISAGALNNMVDMINREFVGGEGIRIEEFSDRIVIRGGKKKEDRSGSTHLLLKKIDTFIVNDVIKNYLVCRRVSGEFISSAIVNVAMPDFFLREKYNGITITYRTDSADSGEKSILYTYQEPSHYTYRMALNVDNEDEVEMQEITPPYFSWLDGSENPIPDIIQAINTGAEIMSDDAGSAIVWQDLNVSGRAFAAFPLPDEEEEEL